MSRLAVLEEPPRATLARTSTRPRGRAAELTALQRSAGNRAVGRLLRQPAVTKTGPKVQSVDKGADENQIVVRLDDGSRYRVRRVPRARRVIDPGRARLGLCHDDHRVWVRVAWCQGTKGTIDVGADPQDAVEDVLKQVGQQILKGGGANDVIRTVEDIKLKPFAKIDIARSKSWTVSSDVTVEVNRQGVGGVDAGVTFDAGWIKLKVTGGGSNLQGDRPDTRVQGQIEIQWGRDPKTVKCPLQQVEILWKYVCERERETVVELKQDPIAHKDPASVFLYFDYEKATLRRDASGPKTRNAEELAKLAELTGAGYRVTGIEGFASPEGKLELPESKGEFHGNIPLAQSRAEAARDQVTPLCTSLLRMRPCFDDKVPVAGRGEVPGLEGDPEGKPLEEAVLPWFTGDPEEMARLTPEDREFVTNPRISRHRRVEKVYEYLRRAEIKLLHEWVEQRPPVKVPLTVYDPLDCPAIVEEAADQHWGSRIPMTLPEPSVCKQQ